MTPSVKAPQDDYLEAFKERLRDPEVQRYLASPLFPVTTPDEKSSPPRPSLYTLYRAWVDRLASDPELQRLQRWMVSPLVATTSSGPDSAPRHETPTPDPSTKPGPTGPESV